MQCCYISEHVYVSVCVFICSSSSDVDIRGCQCRRVTCLTAPVNYSRVNRFERAEQLQLQRLSAYALYSKVIYVLKALELEDKCQTGQILKDPQSRLKPGWSKHSLVISGKQQKRVISFNHTRLLKHVVGMKVMHRKIHGNNVLTLYLYKKGVLFVKLSCSFRSLDLKMFKRVLVMGIINML